MKKLLLGFLTLSVLLFTANITMACECGCCEKSRINVGNECVKNDCNCGCKEDKNCNCEKKCDKACDKKLDCPTKCKKECTKDENVKTMSEIIDSAVTSDCENTEIKTVCPKAKCPCAKNNCKNKNQKCSSYNKENKCSNKKKKECSKKGCPLSEIVETKELTEEE